MRKTLLAVVMVLALAGALAFFNRFTPRVAAQTGEPTPQTETQGDNSRTVDAASPNALTYYAVSNPYCFQPDATRNECSLNVRYSQFTQDGTTAPYLGYMVVKVDTKIRFRSTPFFENTLTYDYNMIPGGLKVACGTPNQGGAGAAYGKSYNLEVSVFTFTDSPIVSNYAPVYCPAFAP